MRVLLIGALISLVIMTAGCTAWPVTETGRETASLPVGIQGTYTVTGDGYGGVAIIRQQGDSYFLQWRLRGQNYAGVGIRDGDRLSAAWFSGNGEKGVVVYRIEPGPTLIGVYVSLPGGGRIRKEVLRFKSPLGTTVSGREVL